MQGCLKMYERTSSVVTAREVRNASQNAMPSHVEPLTLLSPDNVSRSTSRRSFVPSSSIPQEAGTPRLVALVVRCVVALQRCHTIRVQGSRELHICLVTV